MFVPLIFRATLVIAFVSLCASSARAEGQLMKLQPTPWNIDGQPILGTYGAERVEDLEKVHAVGMNVILAGKPELDIATPAGKYCLEKGIKVLPHLTSHIYHGVRLREPVDASQKDIPLHFSGGMPKWESRVIELDGELIRYESMNESGLVGCERGINGTTPADHREGTILFWPEECRTEVQAIKDSPNLFGYYVLDDSPGDARSALQAMYKVLKEVDPARPVCAGFGDAGSITNFAPGVCDILFIYWYPVSTNRYNRERTAQEVQHMLSAARSRVPGVPFVGIYHAFDGRPAKTGQGLPNPDQLREQLEDFVREGASGLVSFICHNEVVPGWADIPSLEPPVTQAMKEIRETGGLTVRPENEKMAALRLQPQGHWEKPNPLPGFVPAWHVAAPFDATGTLLDTPVPPEEGIDPDAIFDVRNGKAKWRVHPTTAGTLGYSNIYGVEKDVIAYAWCEVTSPKEQEVQLRFCSDDDAWVRVNGKEVARYTGVNGLDFDKEIIPITLKKGENRIEVKNCNRAGMWGIFARITDIEGKALEGLKFSPED